MPSPTTATGMMGWLLKGADMTTTTPGRDSGGMTATVLATYGVAILFGVIAGVIGLLLPCEGFLCNVGYGVMGALLGVLASAPATAIIARRNGVRWWYTVIAYGAVIVALVLGATANSVLPSPDELSLLVLAASGPLLGAVFAAPGKLWRRFVIVGLLAVAFVVAPIIADELTNRRWHEQDVNAIERWRTDGLPVFAPVGLEGVVVNSVSVSADSEHRHGSSLYDMSVPGVAGEVRVDHAQETNPGDYCHTDKTFQDLGDGLEGLTGDDGATVVCFTRDGIRVTVREDGFEGQWRGDRLVELARSLQLADPDWLADHLVAR